MSNVFCVNTDEFFHELPRNEQVIANRLRAIILEIDPNMKEKLSYGVPYYIRKRRICFIWPQSASYGPRNWLVTLGFCYGHMLSNQQGVQLIEGRTQVTIIPFSSPADINDDILREILSEAILVDELPFNKTKQRIR